MSEDRQAENDLLRLHLLGDDGGCFTECPTCEGTGSYFPSGGITDTIDECPDCANGRIENRERIARAVLEWLLGFDVDVLASMSQPMMEIPGSKVSNSTTFWDNRHGQPWGTSLTEYVAKYRKPAGEMSTTELLERFSTAIVRGGGGPWIAILAGDRIVGEAVGDDYEETVRAAALDYVNAVEAGKGEDDG